MKLIDPMPF